MTDQDKQEPVTGECTAYTDGSKFYLICAGVMVEITQSEYDEFVYLNRTYAANKNK